MEIQQLKLLAGRIRGLLEQNNHSIGHSVSLDLVSSLPGLRNWPEVLSFPSRVVSCELEMPEVSRLAFRLKKHFSLEFTPQALLEALRPPSLTKQAFAPQIWPTGPKAGVYITTSQEAINALLLKYEDASDGALVYAERAGSHWDGSIDLGEGGLWSNGLERVPSGTLIVVGPLQFNQQSWDESAEHILMACIRAQSSGHRVVVLIESPTPDAIFEDVDLMIRSVQAEGDDYDSSLIGIVTENGEMLQCEPLIRSYVAPIEISSIASLSSIPPYVIEVLKKALIGRKSGLLLFGSSSIEEHSAIDLVSSAITLTESAGPAARIMPRSRSTPSKDWMVPEVIQKLPFLPSIQSAYEQGYRRMIIDPVFTGADVLAQYGSDVMFIAGAYGSEVTRVFMSTGRGSSQIDCSELLHLLIAVLAVTRFSTKNNEIALNDLYISKGIDSKPQLKFDDIENHLRTNRSIRWEDELSNLLDSGQMTVASVKKEWPRNHDVIEFLSERVKK
jgi:hypothetical protein